MSLRISHSQYYTYNTCSRKYDYHYNLRLRAKVISGALLFGSAIDKALGTLLDTRSLDAAKEQFIKSWNFQEINGELTALAHTTKVVYAKTDYDSDLVFEADEHKFKAANPNSDKSLKQLTAFYRELKKEKGHAGLTEAQQKVYNYGHWICMLNKGLIMLDGYYKNILPRITTVHAQQKRMSIKNSEDDEIMGFIDLIATMDDGKTYILDHKTSASEYEQDSAMQSPQLILYYHAEKEVFKAQGVGFIVLYKQLNKNKVKICKLCGHDGSGGRHKTCPNLIEDVRCDGEWIESISPEARFDVILNEVPESAENLVMDAFDATASGIKNKQFIPNLKSCGSGDWTCQFRRLCWEGKQDDLFHLPEGKRY